MVWYGLMHIFKETTTSEESLVVSWEWQPTNLTRKLNILLDGWESLRLRLEYFIPMRKKQLILQSKGAHFTFFLLCFVWHSMSCTLQICFLHLWFSHMPHHHTRMRLEYYIPVKKGFFCTLKLHTFKKKAQNFDNKI